MSNNHWFNLTKHVKEAPIISLVQMYTSKANNKKRILLQVFLANIFFDASNK